MNRVKEFETAYLDYLRTKHADTMAELKTGKYSDEAQATMKAAPAEVSRGASQAAMAGLKEVRNRISSVGSTRQITQAMKLVSAAKLRRAQDAITQMRPYAEKLRRSWST